MAVAQIGDDDSVNAGSSTDSSMGGGSSVVGSVVDPMAEREVDLREIELEIQG